MFFQKYNRDQCDSFKRIFDRNLSEFWTITGFDVIRFDDWLGTPDGVSTHDHLKTSYGEEALALVEGFLKP